jgi:hypothetical protein
MGSPPTFLRPRAQPTATTRRRPQSNLASGVDSAPRCGITVHVCCMQTDEYPAGAVAPSRRAHRHTSPAWTYANFRQFSLPDAYSPCHHHPATTMPYPFTKANESTCESCAKPGKFLSHNAHEKSRKVRKAKKYYFSPSRSANTWTRTLEYGLAGGSRRRLA